MPLKHQNGNNSKQPSTCIANDVNNVAEDTGTGNLEDCCKITPLCKPSNDSKDASNDIELPSTSTYLSVPVQNTTTCTQSMQTEPTIVSPRRQEFRHPEPKMPRPDIKDTLGSSEGDKNKPKDNIIFMDMIQRSTSNDQVERFITRNPRHEFDHLTKTIEELLVSHEKSKRELVYMKGVVERYKAEFDRHRLNSKTKEIEAILLINENEKLKEEIAQLRVHSSATTDAPGDKPVPGNETPKSDVETDSLSSQRASRCASSTTSTPRPNSIADAIDAFELSKGKYSALAPLSKPKIYRRPHLTDPRARQRLERTLFMSEAAVKFKQSLESGRSQSDTCTGPQGTDRSLATESSMSVPDIQIECINFNNEK